MGGRSGGEGIMVAAIGGQWICFLDGEMGVRGGPARIWWVEMGLAVQRGRRRALGEVVVLAG